VLDRLHIAYSDVVVRDSDRYVFHPNRRESGSVRRILGFCNRLDGGFSGSRLGRGNALLRLWRFSELERQDEGWDWIYSAM
jgi:hypothetical protein